jgi:hypothetical protein
MRLNDLHEPDDSISHIGRMAPGANLTRLRKFKEKAVTVGEPFLRKIRRPQIDDRLKSFIREHAGKDILVKFGDGDGTPTTRIPGCCGLLEDYLGVFITHHADNQEPCIVDGKEVPFDFTCPYGPILYKVERTFDLDDLVDLRGTEYEGDVATHVEDAIDPATAANVRRIYDASVAGDPRAAAQLKKIRDLVDHLQPGVIGSVLLDPEFYINVPCRLTPITIALDPWKDIGEGFHYRIG